MSRNSSTLSVQAVEKDRIARESVTLGTKVEENHRNIAGAILAAVFKLIPPGSDASAVNLTLQTNVDRQCYEVVATASPSEFVPPNSKGGGA